MSSRGSTESDKGPFIPRKNCRFQKGYTRCVYDWSEKNSWSLECTTKNHSHPCIILMDRFGAGADTLVALLEEGMLTGAALKDAAKAAEDRRFLEGL